MNKPLKIAFIARSTLYQVHGGITIQVTETARHLQKLGIDITIHLANEKINYQEYDLLHFFDVIRPANILYHIKRSGKPFVITPILIDYSEYDKYHRKGIPGLVFRIFSADTNEYLKTVSRWILGKDSMQSKSYLWKGQKASIREILDKVSLVLPNSQKENEELIKRYQIKRPYAVIPNGIKEDLFQPDNSAVRDNKLVLCVARVEGIKNQLNLIRALNNTNFRLLLIGDAAQNQRNYWHECKKIAANNVEFIEHLAQEELIGYYKKAKVHVLPSWFETCGLSSLEAAAMGCNIVITDKGFTTDYFGDDAFYCSPSDPGSIYSAVKAAAESPERDQLQEKILNTFTWEKAAAKTLEAYSIIVSKAI